MNVFKNANGHQQFMIEGTADGLPNEMREWLDENVGLHYGSWEVDVYTYTSSRNFAIWYVILYNDEDAAAFKLKFS